MSATPDTPDVSPRHSPRFLVTAALGVIWGTLPGLMGFVLLAKIGPVGDWLRAHPEQALLAYIVGFAVTSGFGLLPTYAIAALGGWVFGFPVGLSAALAGFVGGGLIGFAISRLIGGDALKAKLDEHPRSRIIRNAFVESGFWKTLGIVALLRLPPNSPFSLTNLALAGSGVRLHAYLLGTIIGMTPRTAIMIGVGAAGAVGGAKDIQELVGLRNNWQIAAAVALTIVVLVILAQIGKAALRRVEAGVSAPPV